ncbi:hypothetical protein P7K49_021403 [Saguinus oedipus]|uniref:Uncharacterized protein n=1 Tax=Saguinus oedipus TaxID=9490 RepID=A0ABQ9USK5_SAGOE|nr:hypothetical protein P7K49_021403 [Saguinus oedipus]
MGTSPPLKSPDRFTPRSANMLFLPEKVRGEETKPALPPRPALPNSRRRPGVHTLLRPRRSEERDWRGDPGPRGRGPAVARGTPLACTSVWSLRAEGLSPAGRNRAAQ